MELNSKGTAEQILETKAILRKILNEKRGEF
jgi:hypothetical protein